MQKYQKTNAKIVTQSINALDVKDGDKRMKRPFKDDEMEIIYHAAMEALSDATIFDGVATYLDIADDELGKIRERLLNYLTENEVENEVP